MATTVKIDPLTRIEGHLSIKVDVEAGRVARAWSVGEMFRGFEKILSGRDPLDAQQITQRICGVCPISHGVASILAQDAAYGIRPTPNGRLLRNLILGANTLQSHIIHFYHLSALDFVDIAAITTYQGRDAAMNALKEWVRTELESNSLHPAAPFLPRWDADYIQSPELNHLAIRHYLEALDIRRLAHEMAALFGGKIPHATALVPGGVTEHATSDKIAACRGRLEKVRAFVETCYLPDIEEVARAFPQYLEIGRGCGGFLAYSAYRETDDGTKKLFPAGVLVDGRLEDLNTDAIREHVEHSFFAAGPALHPSAGRTDPQPHKEDAYSWIKAPRYQERPMEVGPLARVLIVYKQGGNPRLNELVDGLLSRLGAGPEALDSVMGRHAARAIESLVVAERMETYLDGLRPGKPTFTDFEIPQEGEGVGLTEAPRGALGHWVRIENHRIANYQCVVPTTWNCSPRDDQGTAGPVEQSLVGTPVADPANPMEPARVVRSFDPCIACAVH